MMIIGVLVAALLPSSYAGEGPWSISPEHPRVGEEVLLTYDAGVRTANLKEAAAITGEAMLIPYRGTPELLEIPLTRNGAQWSGTFVLPAHSESLLLFRFVAGDAVDDNGRNVWSALVHGADGTPVRNAHYMRTFILMGMGMGDFKHDKDVEAAKAEAEAEKALYPDNVAAWGFLWGQMLREAPGDSTMSRIKKELDALYALKKDDPAEGPNFVAWFGRTAQQSKADELKAAALAKDPKGAIARSAAEQAMYAERDPRKRIAMMEQFVGSFDLTETEKEEYLSRMAASHSSVGDVRGADSVLSLMKHPNAMAYNNIAWSLLEKAGDPARAATVAKKGIALLRAPDPSTKPGYWSVNAWKKSNRQSLSFILDTYGLAMEKLKKYDEAYDAYAEADSLIDERDLGMVERLIASAEKTGKSGKVIEFAERSIRTGMSSDSVLAMYTRAYVAKHGPGNDVRKTVASLKAGAAKDLRDAMMKSRIDRPAPAFTVKGLDGKPVSLGSLKGKVVVLDFWATWCGPCKVSMPFLQKTYEKYKANPRVAFYAVDVWEQQTGEELASLVKAFIHQNKYTFPVLYGGDMAEKFGVEGIPAKFVLDQQGKIQFKAMGAEGEEMVAKLSSQIDLLLGQD